MNCPLGWDKKKTNLHTKQSFQMLSIFYGIYNDVDVQYPQRYSWHFYRVLSCVYPIVSCVYPIVSCVYPIVRVSYRIVYQVFRFLSCFAFIRSIVYRVLRVSGFPFIVSCIFGNYRDHNLNIRKMYDTFRKLHSFCLRSYF